MRNPVLYLKTLDSRFHGNDMEGLVSQKYYEREDSDV